MKRYLVFGAAVAASGVFAASAVAQPAFVQGTTNSGSGTSLAQSYASNVAPGDLLVAMVRTGGNTSVSDNQDGNWTETQSSPDGVNSMWYFQDAKGGPTTVTLTGSSAGPMRLVLAEYSGVALTSALDGESCDTTVGATASTGTADGSAAGDLAVAGLGAYPRGIIVGAGPGSTLRNQLTGSNGTSAEEDVLHTANPDQAQSFSLSSAPSDGEAACEALFKPASGPSALAVTASPTITGTDVQGDTLTATPGTWTGGPASYTYQWQDCSAAICSNISGATSSSYQLQPSDVGDTVDVVVTATNSSGSTSATSAQTSTIQGGGSTPTWYGELTTACPDTTVYPGNQRTLQWLGGSLSCPSDPLGSGQTVAEMYANASSGDARADLFTPYMFTEGSNYWISVPVYVNPNGFPTVYDSGTSFQQVWQFDHAGNCCNPIMGEGISRENWETGADLGSDHWQWNWNVITTNDQVESSAVGVWIGPQIDNRWHTMMLHVYFTTSNSGTVQLYWDGVQQAFTNGQTTLTGASLPPLNEPYGLDIDNYHASAIGATTIYHGAPRIGTTEASVEPDVSPQGP
ncbi:MAG: heparin lyase I family protein [Solirubrobacterales bacterium]|nr:heparin lyase I family protein [Solirubrobacterales bacterium]